LIVMPAGLKKSLLDVLFPPRCIICRSFIPRAGSIHICSDCLKTVRYIENPCCTICGEPFHGAGISHVCGSCAARMPGYDMAKAALIYDGICRDLIHAFKYDYKTHLRHTLANLAVEAFEQFVEECCPDVVVPVPLCKRRLVQRGFNQAVLLAELLAGRRKIPLERQAMRRTRWTEPQIKLDAEQRRMNVEGAFAVLKPGSITDKRILLLDDVLTTGSTADECARVLKKSGAVSVDVFTLARAVTA